LLCCSVARASYHTQRAHLAYNTYIYSLQSIFPQIFIGISQPANNYLPHVAGSMPDMFEKYTVTIHKLSSCSALPCLSPLILLVLSLHLVRSLFPLAFDLLHTHEHPAPFHHFRASDPLVTFLPQLVDDAFWRDILATLTHLGLPHFLCYGHNHIQQFLDDCLITTTKLSDLQLDAKDRQLGEAHPRYRLCQGIFHIFDGGGDWNWYQ
jgi:hypothetical protein